MFTVTPAPAPVHDLFAAPLRDQQLGDTGITVLVLLVTVAILLFQALRAIVTAVLSLLLPALALFRSLVFVVGLIGVIGYGLVAGTDEESAPAPPVPTTAPTTAIR
jgi:hypothetical protein